MVPTDALPKDYQGPKEEKLVFRRPKLVRRVTKEDAGKILTN